MNNDLRSVINELYREFSPLNNVDRQLIGQQSPEDFQKLVQTKTQRLDIKKQQRVMDELFGWGPITDLLNKTDIFDIIIQGPDCIYYETPQGLTKHDDCFLSQRSFDNFVTLVTKEAKMLVNQRDPFGNGQVLSFRVHMVTPPISQQTILTLRRHQKKIFSLDNLTDQQFISSEELLFFKKLINERRNFLIVGPTGSGKTTFLNSLINESSDTDRLVIVEDTDEIYCEHPLACKLLSREICPESLKPIFMEDLVKQSLRMRPDRIVVGEIRGAEAKDLLQALATGHEGSMGTLHASSGKQALIRLEMLIQMGAPQWSLYSIRQLIQMSLEYLIVLKPDRLNKGVMEISRIASHEKFGLLLESMKPFRL